MVDAASGRNLAPRGAKIPAPGLAGPGHSSVRDVVSVFLRHAGRDQLGAELLYPGTDGNIAEEVVPDLHEIRRFNGPLRKRIEILALSFK